MMNSKPQTKEGILHKDKKTGLFEIEFSESQTKRIRYPICTFSHITTAYKAIEIELLKRFNEDWYSPLRGTFTDGAQFKPKQQIFASVLVIDFDQHKEIEVQKEYYVWLNKWPKGQDAPEAELAGLAHCGFFKFDRVKDSNFIHQGLAFQGDQVGFYVLQRIVKGQSPDAQDQVRETAVIAETLRSVIATADVPVEDDKRKNKTKFIIGKYLANDRDQEGFIVIKPGDATVPLISVELDNVLKSTNIKILDNKGYVDKNVVQNLNFILFNISWIWGNDQRQMKPLAYGVITIPPPSPPFKIGKVRSTQMVKYMNIQEILSSQVGCPPEYGETYEVLNEVFRNGSIHEDIVEFDQLFVKDFDFGSDNEDDESQVVSQPEEQKEKQFCRIVNVIERTKTFIGILEYDTNASAPGAGQQSKIKFEGQYAPQQERQSEPLFYLKPIDKRLPRRFIIRVDEKNELSKFIAEKKFESQKQYFTFNVFKDQKPGRRDLDVDVREHIGPVTYNDEPVAPLNIPVNGEPPLNIKVETEIKISLIENNVNLKQFNESEEEKKEFQAFVNSICDKQGQLLITKQQREKRKDLTHLDVFTVDAITTIVIDDAISIEKIDDHTYQVGVHIADSSYFVKEGSVLDSFGKRRISSVYLPNNFHQMLPPKICRDLGSIHPDKQRFAVSVFMRISNDGDLLDYPIRMEKSIIQSKCKMTYDIAQKIINFTVKTHERLLKQLRPVFEHNQLEINQAFTLQTNNISPSKEKLQESQQKEGEKQSEEKGQKLTSTEKVAEVKQEKGRKIHLEKKTSEKIINDTLTLFELSKNMNQKRVLNGSLIFNLDQKERNFLSANLAGDMEIEVDSVATELESPTITELEECEDANMMIQQYMTLCNFVVGREMKRRGFAFLRCQEYPDDYNRDRLVKFLKPLNLEINYDQKNFSIRQGLVRWIEDEQLSDPFKKVLLYKAGCLSQPSEMKIFTQEVKALFSKEQEQDLFGFFSFNFECYTWFTSPLRRYIDLMVHRIVSKMIYHPTEVPGVLDQNYKNLVHTVNEKSKNLTRANRSATRVDKKLTRDQPI